MEIKKLKSTVLGAGKYVLYGPSGSGKTFSISTLPAGTLILAVEKGLRTLLEVAPELDVADINSLQDMRDAFNFLASNPTSHPTVVIDSLSELGELALTEAKAQTKDGRQQYQLMADTISGIIKSFNDLPQTVIFTAQEERVNQEDLGLLDYVYAPAIPGRKFATRVPYKFDYVFCLRTKVSEDGTVERRFQTGMKGDYLAKSRSLRLQVFEEPNWTHIFNKLQGE